MSATTGPDQPIRGPAGAEPAREREGRVREQDNVRETAPSVVVVSRVPVVKAGLESFLAPDVGVRLVDGVDVVDPTTPRDVTIYDLSGLVHDEQELRMLVGSSAVVALRPVGRDDLAERAAELGVAAVVPLEASRSELLELIGRLVAEPGTQPEGGRRTHGLSRREEEIVRLIAAGRTNGEIADQLYLSVNSVKTYIRTAYRKMGVSRRSHAVVWAVEHGLTRR